MNILVLGLGNVLMGDDAFGPSAIDALRAQFAFPECVTLLDGGTPGLNLMAELIDTGVLIVIDTVKAKGNPGEMRLYRNAELSSAGRNPRQGPHEPALSEVLTALDLAGRAPAEVLLIGVIPASVETGEPMSAPVREALPGAVRSAVDELQRLGVPVTPRSGASFEPPWWERPVEISASL